VCFVISLYERVLILILRESLLQWGDFSFPTAEAGFFFFPTAADFSGFSPSFPPLSVQPLWFFFVRAAVLFSSLVQRVTRLIGLTVEVTR